MAVVLCLTASLRAAETYGFYGFNNNHPDNIAIGEAQLFVDVSDAGSGEVLFRFYNTGPYACVITGIHFHDQLPLVLGNSPDIINGQGVLFVAGMHPGGTFPGGENLLPSFESDEHLAARAFKAKLMENGVGPGQELGLRFEAVSGFAELIAGLDAGSLRIGLQVQGFPYGGDNDSAQFVNNGPPPVIPAPGAVMLAGIGTVMVGWLRRRRSI